MSEAEIVNIILRIREQVDFLWHFYVSSCAILIGWLFSTRIEWTKEKHQVTSILFITFAVVNIFAIYKEYVLLESALTQLKELATGSPFAYQLANSEGLGASVAFLVHAAADIVILQLIRIRYNRVITT